MDVFEKNLIALEQLSRKYNLHEQANWVSEFLAIYGQSKYFSFINEKSLDFWGKLFCIGDTMLYPEDDSISQRESNLDNHNRHKSIRIIYEELGKAGFSNPKVGQMVELFKYWEEIDVYKIRE